MKTENILVVPTIKLFPTSPFQGLSATVTSYLDVIKKYKEFHPRSLMELDTNYKQIIPYLLFNFEDRYFIMQRRSTSSEQRLKNKFSLGIGGHMRQEDMLNGATIFDWAQREFKEEIDYSGKLSITPLGVLNDDSNDVGKVHLGLVLLLKGDSPTIKIRSELKSGQLVSLIECLDLYPEMESWSQIIFDEILRKDLHYPVLAHQPETTF